VSLGRIDLRWYRILSLSPPYHTEMPMPETKAAAPILRIARPSDDLDALLPFYRDGLGLTVLYRFEDHAGFDGVMLGGKGAP